MSWQTEYQIKLMTPEHVAAHFMDGDVIGMGGGTGIPPAIAKALSARVEEMDRSHYY